MTIEKLVDTFLAVEIPHGSSDLLDCILDEVCCCFDSNCERGCAVCWRNFLVKKLEEELGNEELYEGHGKDVRGRKRKSFNL